MIDVVPELELRFEGGAGRVSIPSQDMQQDNVGHEHFVRESLEKKAASVIDITSAVTDAVTNHTKMPGRRFLA